MHKLFFLLFVLICNCFAEEPPSCKVKLEKSQNIFPYKLAIGDNVTLQNFGLNQTQHNLFFLGRSIINEKTYYMFAEEIEHPDWYKDIFKEKFEELPREFRDHLVEIPIRVVMSKVDSTIIEVNGSHPKKEEVQSIFAIEHQKGPTCFANSAFNGLIFLSNFCNFPNITQLLQDKDAVLAEIHTWNDEALKRSVSLSQSLYKLNEIKTFRSIQMDKRKDYFQNLGVPLFKTRSTDDLIAHLKKGLPAFIDVLIDTKIAFSQFIETKTLGVGPITLPIAPVPVFTPAEESDSIHMVIDSHSVLAVNYIESTRGKGNGYFLVADSSVGGHTQVWPEAMLRNALNEFAFIWLIGDKSNL